MAPRILSAEIMFGIRFIPAVKFRFAGAKIDIFLRVSKREIRYVAVGKSFGTGSGLLMRCRAGLCS